VQKFVISRMVWLAILVSFSASSQLATNVTVTNLQGEAFQNITIDPTNLLGVVWVAQDGGMGQFRWGDFPMEFWNTLSVSNSAQQYYADIKVAYKQVSEEQAREKQEAADMAENNRRKAAARANIEQNILKELSVSNSEEQTVNAMASSPKDMTADEISARDGILKSLLDVSSSTSVGVSRNDYGNLLAKATSAVEFGKTKLSSGRYPKFLTCAEKALHFYTKANDKWSDYFQYDWQREKDQTLMFVSDFRELEENGVTVDVSNYKRADTSDEWDAQLVDYYVPFKESLTLYWQAADIYVHKMQQDSQR
jgi:hypothetical protein